MYKVLPYFLTWQHFIGVYMLQKQLTSVGLSQQVERLTGRDGGRGSNFWIRPILRILKQLRNEGTAFALQTGGPSRGLDDHLKWRSHKRVLNHYFYAKYNDTLKNLRLSPVLCKISFSHCFGRKSVCTPPGVIVRFRFLYE